jgi:hypothetical protein
VPPYNEGDLHDLLKQEMLRASLPDVDPILKFIDKLKG